VSISSTFSLQLFCTNVVSAAFTTCMQLEKAAETTFVQKIHTFNVDEIDTWEGSISPSFYEQLFFNESVLSSFFQLTVCVCIFWLKNIGTKAGCKMFFFPFFVAKLGRFITSYFLLYVTKH